LYFRWGSCAISGVFVICILLVHFDTAIDAIFELPALETFVKGQLLDLFAAFSGNLPISIVSATEATIADSPVLCLLGLVGMGVAFRLMRHYRQKIVETQEASWDVVRIAHSTS
jgi:hypothetical protein